MQVQPESPAVHHNFERIANVLRYAGWGNVVVQLGLAIASVLCLIFAVSGRSVSPTFTPGIGIGIFFAVCSLAALLVSLYFAFRWTRFGRLLRHPNPIIRPAKADVMTIVRLGIIVGFVGLLLAILGGGATLGVLLAKSVALPQGVAIYDPTQIIRSLDIFVAIANMNAIAAHFVNAAAALGLFNWLSKQ